MYTLVTEDNNEDSKSSNAAAEGTDAFHESDSPWSFPGGGEKKPWLISSAGFKDFTCDISVL